MKKFFHGVACYPELWPEADLARDIDEMKRVGINVVRIGEFAWSKMEPDEGSISLDCFMQRGSPWYSAHPRRHRRSGSRTATRNVVLWMRMET